MEILFKKRFKLFEKMLTSTRFCRHARLTASWMCHTSNTDSRRLNNRQQSTSAADVGSKAVKKSFASPAELRQAWQSRRQPLFEVVKMRDLVRIDN